MDILKRFCRLFIRQVPRQIVSAYFGPKWVFTCTFCGAINTIWIPFGSLWGGVEGLPFSGIQGYGVECRIFRACISPRTSGALVYFMGGCQNCGPFLGTLNIRCRIIIGTQKGTIILTTTHMAVSRNLLGKPPPLHSPWRVARALLNC